MENTGRLGGARLSLSVSFTASHVRGSGGNSHRPDFPPVLPESSNAATVNHPCLCAKQEGAGKRLEPVNLALMPLKSPQRRIRDYLTGMAAFWRSVTYS